MVTEAMILNSSAFRTQNYLSQLKGSFILKFLALLASFMLVPMMINYLGSDIYGVWSTLFSVVSWVLLFDLGIGAGLRNRISEAIAHNNILEAKQCVSTSYVVVGIGAALLLLLFVCISNYVSWVGVFNISGINETDLQLAVEITMSFVLLNFLLSLINQVANGLQKTVVSVFNQFFSNIILLLFVFVLSVFFESSIVLLSLVYGIALTISNLLVTYWFFKKYKDLTPRLFLFNLKDVRALLSTGLRFFSIQIAVIVLFTTDKIVISQLLGPGFVTQYDVVFKLFSLVTVVHGIIIAPLWAAYSDAYHREDFIWVSNMMNKQLKIFVIISLFVVLLALTSSGIIHWWIGPEFNFSWNLAIPMAIFVTFTVWNNIFAFFLNGINELKIQTRISAIAMFINIPLSIVFVKYFAMGVEGVIFATTIALSIFAIAGPIQTRNILLKTKNAV